MDFLLCDNCGDTFDFEDLNDTYDGRLLCDECLDEELIW